VVASDLIPPLSRDTTRRAWLVLSVSAVEVLNYLKRIAQGGVLATSLMVMMPSFREHRFAPEIEVTDAGTELTLTGLLYKVKVVGDCPVYLNIDRPVGEEYTVVYPGSYYVIPRIGTKLYLKAPTGYRTRVRVEALW
jgi:hypothetical protein